jgi:hypothetical protein
MVLSILSSSVRRIAGHPPPGSRLLVPHGENVEISGEQGEIT